MSLRSSPPEGKTAPDASENATLARIASCLAGHFVFFSLTASGDVVYLSPGAGVFFGRPEKEILGRPLSAVLLLDAANALPSASDFVCGGKTCLGVARTLCPNGLEKTVNILSWPLPDAQGRLAGVDGFLADMASCALPDPVREEHRRLHRIIFEHAPIGLIHFNAQGVATSCNQRFADSLGAAPEKYVGFNGLARLTNPAVRQALIRAINGETAQYEGPYASVIGKRAGFFRIVFTPTTPGRVPSEVIGMFEDVTESKRVEEALRESEKRHRTIFENSPLGMIHFSDDGTIINCNDTFVELMGSSRQALIGFNTPRQTNNGQMRQCATRALAGERTFFEGEYTSVTGAKTTFLRVVFNPVNPGASPTEVIATLEDIGDRVKADAELADYRKRLEEMVRARTEELTAANARLRENEEKLRRIVEHSGDLFYSHTPEGVLTYVSPRCREYFECDPDEAMVHWADFVSDAPENNLVREFTAKAVATGQRQPPYVCEILSKKGRKRWVEVRESPVVRDGAAVAVVGALSDITDRKNAEDALRKSEAGLVMAQRMAHFGSFIWNRATDIMELSEEMARILGLPDESRSLSRPAFWEMLHPDDLPRALEKFQALLQADTPFEGECRLIRPDGEVRLVNVLAAVTKRNEDQAAEASGVLHDVTDRRRAEDQLELAKRVFDHAVEGVAVTDATGAIQFVNPGFTRITGYEATEVVGQNPRILKSDRHPPEFYDSMWRTIRERGFWEGEIWNRRKTGEAYPEWLTITAVPGPDGAPARYVSIFHDVSELWKREQELKHQANHDGLTDLPNRNLFLDRLDVAVLRAKRSGEMIIVVLADLDNFKTINDALGHPAGDRLLQELAGRLSPPASWQATVARPGGDEFLFFLERADDEDLPRVANWFFRNLEKPFHIDDRDFYMTVSLGMAVFPPDGANAGELVKNADLALHQSKQFGRNTYSLYRPELNEMIRKRLELENALRLALERDEIVVHYQPQADAATGRIVGMEALARWKHGDRLVSPLDFIPLAEETGLIVPIGEFILRQACLSLQRLRVLGHSGLRVSVNLSARQFAEPDLAPTVARVLEETGLAPSLLELEITESAFIGDAKAALETARGLCAQGVLLSLDDFGTGYSSLSYLRLFPIHTLKIDKSFVDDIPDNPEANALAGAVIALARNLRMTVVAEGVETAEQLWYLREQKCELIQGYLVSRPLPEPELDVFLAANPHYPLFAGENT